MTQENINTEQSWLFRFVKGMFVGSGFIIPGVSGGALAAIFGIYEPLISFLANPFRKLKDNIKFFLPVGIGALASIALLSWGVSFLLGNYETIVRWFFVGAVLGTLPALWKEAGEEGRSNRDLIIMVMSFALGIIILFFGASLFDGQVPANFWSWILSGALIALGVLIPGLSPSNFILYMGLYQDMADGFKTMDLSVIIPIAIGGLLTILGLAKLIEWIFQRYYAQFFHFVFGIVVASTLMIIPAQAANYAGFTLVQYGLCALMLAVGIGLGWYMAQLEEKYK